MALHERYSTGNIISSQQCITRAEQCNVLRILQYCKGLRWVRQPKSFIIDAIMSTRKMVKAIYMRDILDDCPLEGLYPAMFNPGRMCNVEHINAQQPKAA